MAAAAAASLLRRRAGWLAAAGGEAAAIAAASSASARRALGSATRPAHPGRPPTPPPPGVAFAFDIDGVLLRGKHAIPGAADALRRLVGLAPYVFITNGGGVTEADKAAELCDLLGLPASAARPDQMLLAHTPFRRLATAEPVLVIGGKQSLAVAKHAYGFTAAASPAQVAAATDASVPLRPPHAVEHVGPLPTHPVTGAPAGSPAWPFTAVLVLHDPECWYTDVQITTDVLVGRGVVAGGWAVGSRRAGSDRPLPLHWSNGDVLWAGEHPAPRLGQGAFAAALRAVVTAAGHGDALAGERVYGKPTSAPYELADAALAAQAARLAASLPGELGAAWRRTGVRAVIGVGDNPAADAAGAAAAGDPWIPVLVRTGVHDGPGNCPVHPAAAVVDDVCAAVEWGCRLGVQKAREWGVGA